MEDKARTEHDVRSAYGSCNAPMHAGRWVLQSKGALGGGDAPASASSRGVCRTSAWILAVDWAPTMPNTVAFEPAPTDHDYAHDERCPSQREWNGRTPVCRDGTLRKKRPLRDEQKHHGGRKHGPCG